MMSIFDDSAAGRNGLRFLLDAVLSLLRQWLLRARYGARRTRPAFAAGLSPEQLHRESERLQKRAGRLNLAWVLSVIPLQIFVAAQVNPVTQTVGAATLYALLPVMILLSLHLRFNCLSDGGSLSSILSAGRSRRIELERKRQKFMLWAESTGTILIVCLAIWAIPVLIGSLFTGVDALRSWAFVNSVVIGTHTLAFFAILKRSNNRAVIALQREIDSGTVA
jgi:hypothetical protein